MITATSLIAYGGYDLASRVERFSTFTARCTAGGGQRVVHHEGDLACIDAHGVLGGVR